MQERTSESAYERYAESKLEIGHESRQKVTGICVLALLAVCLFCGCTTKNQAVANEATVSGAKNNETMISEVGAWDNPGETDLADRISQYDTNRLINDDTAAGQAINTANPAADISWSADTFPIIAPEDVAEEEFGNPRSSYGLGSAAYLKGRVVLVSVFVTTLSYSFAEEEQLQTLNKLRAAAEYITEQAANYGIDTEMLCDWSQDGYDELYREMTIDFEVTEEEDSQRMLDECIDRLLTNEVIYEQLMSDFDADQIAACLFVNGSGRSYAIVYDGVDNVRESLVIFTMDSSGREEGAATYVHEILHLFGAHDLYEGAEFAADVTDYVAQQYPDEIMRTTSGEGLTITQQISPITAYHLGWADTLPELAQFPALQRSR